MQTALKLNADLLKAWCLLIEFISVGLGTLGRACYFKKKIKKIYFFSVGDSFTQFQFADEKEWDKESICRKQVTELSFKWVCIDNRLAQNT